MRFKPGDVVLVVSAKLPTQPQPGAVGTVRYACACFPSFLTYAFTEQYTYSVQFDATRSSCYQEKQLRKLEPMADEATELREATQDAPAKVTL